MLETKARRRAVLTCAGIAAVFLAPVRGAAGSEAVVEAIETLEAEWFSVYQSHDLGVLDRLIADDFVATLADGAMRGKREHIAAYPADFAALVSVVNQELRVRAMGPDVAVATGLYVATARGAGGPGLATRYRYTDTWLRRNGSWRCVATHESRLDPPAPSAAPD
jgi:uncharacterized protein (TIGR02246 family)